MAASLAWPGAASAQRERVDLALVLAVDVSDSVDAERYALQMNGIARAFEDPQIQSAMLSGPRRAMLVALVTWSNRATVALPWTLLTGSDDIGRFAAEVRRAGLKAPGTLIIGEVVRLRDDLRWFDLETLIPEVAHAEPVHDAR